MYKVKERKEFFELVSREEENYQKIQVLIQIADTGTLRTRRTVIRIQELRTNPEKNKKDKRPEKMQNGVPMRVRTKLRRKKTDGPAMQSSGCTNNKKNGKMNL